MRYPVLAKSDKFIHPFEHSSACMPMLLLNDYSSADLIMNDRCTRLADKNFDNLVFLNVKSWMETK